MGNILLVEDDQNIIIGLKSIIKSIDSNQKIIMTAYASKALEYSKNNDVDLFVLDIQLKDYNGIELAKQLREIEKYKLTPIIFITALLTRELEAFRNIHCYEYIIKPFSEIEVKEVLETIIKYGIKSTQSNLSVLKIKQKDFTHVINLDEIVFVEIRNKKLYVRTINEEMSYSTYTLNQIIEELPETFLQCHRSFLVNSKMVKKVDRKNSLICFSSIQDTVPYSRKYKEVLRGEWL